MEKRIILDEQDINEFHSDADVLQWIYNLITKEYRISECSKNIPRFARIIDKLKKLQRMKSIFSMFAYWDRVHQFPDGHIKVENNLAWRRKHLHVLSRNKQLIFQRMKKETRNVVVLDWEDKIKLQQFIEDLEQISETYQSPCKELTGINNTLYYLKTIEEEINQCMKIRFAKKDGEKIYSETTASQRR